MWGTYAAWVHMVFFPQCGKLWGTKLLIPTLPFILTKFLLRLKFCRNFVEMGKKIVEKNVQCGIFWGFILKKSWAPWCMHIRHGQCMFFFNQSISINYWLSKLKSINSYSIIDFQNFKQSISIQLLTLQIKVNQLGSPCPT